MARYPCPSDCPIPGAYGFQHPDGLGTSRVLILGEAMGSSEAAQGRGFVQSAEAGSVLAMAIRRSGFTRDQFILWNVVPTQPPKNWLEGAPWEAEAIAWGRPYLLDVIERYKPAVILALGNVALKATTGMVGDYRSITHLRGYVLPTSYPEVVAIGSYHPSFLRRSKMNWFPILVHDLKLAVQVAAHGGAVFDPYNPPIPGGYVTHPSEDEAWSYFNKARDNSRLLLTYDIETPRSKATSEDETDELGDTEILSIQFSLGKGEGIFMPWTEPYISIAKAMLALPNEKAQQNGWRFDDPLLAAHGAPVVGKVHDIRWAWHHLQPELPAGLQQIASFYDWPFPWKHLHESQEEFYGICDVDVLQWIVPTLFEDIHKRGIWRGYERHVLRLEPILVRASERGIPVDPAKHAEVQRSLGEQVAALDERMQALVPDEVRLIHPKEGYKKEPKGAVEGAATTHAGKPAKWAKRDFTIASKPTSNEEIVTPPEAPTQEERWVKLLHWSPAHDGLIRYMEYRGHPVPRDWKTGKATVAELELTRLARRVPDPVYDLVRERSDLNTLLTNHVRNWTPGADGRVHPIFYYETATGQLGARRPNSMNAPKHKAVQGDLFRSMIVAPPGRVILDVDYKSFHVATLAFAARDADLLRMARLDIHSYVTAHLLHLPDADVCYAWDDEKLGAYLASVKEKYKAIRDAKVKHAFLGYDNGMGYRKLWNQYQEFFENIGEARKVMVLLDSLFPITKRYRDRIKYEGLQRGYIVSPAGSIRYFWDQENDGEAALSFLTQNLAHGHLKDAMIRLDDRGLMEMAQFINPVHDALMFLPEEGGLDYLIHEIAWEMEQPSEVMVDPIIAPGGLAVEVSVSIGRSWNQMRELKRGEWGEAGKFLTD